MEEALKVSIGGVSFIINNGISMRIRSMNLVIIFICARRTFSTIIR